MTGLIVLGFIASYVLLAWFIIKAAPGIGGKTAAVTFSVLIPFWDLPFGYANFHRNCSEYGGVHFASKVGANEAILVDQDIGYQPDELIRLGYRVVEYGSPGRILRFTATSSGLVKSTHDAALSQIKVHAIGNQVLPWNLMRQDFLITRIDTGTVLARHTEFRWRGLWWQVQAAPLLGEGIRCYSRGGEQILPAVARGK
jgi:hypothetical protein